MNPIAKFMYRTSKAYWEEKSPEEQWRNILTGEDPILRRFRHFFKHIPTQPRCKLCNAPFQGLGAPWMRLIGRSPSTLNPLFCRICLETAPVGGAEIELTMLFADVRGSTKLAEQMSAAKFGQLINQFFSTATKTLIHTNALIDRLVGDEVIALYIPAYTGKDHAQLAVEGAKELLEATGHSNPDGPWIPVGIGVHTDTAFVGKVGEEGVHDITVLGDAPNVTSRLASLSGIGEILLSDATFTCSQLSANTLHSRQLELKGRLEPLIVWSLTTAPG